MSIIVVYNAIKISTNQRQKLNFIFHHHSYYYLKNYHFRSIALLGAANHLKNNEPHKISTNYQTLPKNETNKIAYN